MSSSERLFVTVGRLTVPWAAAEALLKAEDRGVRLRADGDVIHVEPPGILTDDEKNAIRKWRWHVLALLTAFEGQEVQ